MDNELLDDRILTEISQLVNITQDAIDDALVTHSSNYVWYSVLLTRASSKRLKLKFRLDVLRAELSKSIRAQAAQDGIKLTEAMVENEILTNPEYQAKYEEFLSAREQEGVLEALVKGMEQRKDLLVSYVSLRREELKSKVAM